MKHHNDKLLAELDLLLALAGLPLLLLLLLELSRVDRRSELEDLHLVFVVDLVLEVV